MPRAPPGVRGVRGSARRAVRPGGESGRGPLRELRSETAAPDPQALECGPGRRARARHGLYGAASTGRRGACVRRALLMVPAPCASRGAGTSCCHLRFPLACLACRGSLRFAGMAARCELCGREARTTRHHLVPKSRKRSWKKTSGDAELPTADLCRDCHEKVHATFGHRELETAYRSIEALRAAPELASYIKWIRKQPPTVRFHTRQDRRRGGR